MGKNQNTGMLLTRVFYQKYEKFCVRFFMKIDSFWGVCVGFELKIKFTRFKLDMIY